ncbi:MAG: DUF4982 domain-containing protein [Muribaculaceae bacterium]|nr:DUF4982 domain-containing protein [Muribaculaceae bacterium]
MKRLFIAITILAVIHLAADAFTRPGREYLFNDAWRFALTTDTAASLPAYDDSGWRLLNLPHDWAIEGNFSPDNPSGTSGGALPGGMGWYRKTLNVTPDELRDRFILDFDGAYMNSTVFVNGDSVYTRPYGYAPFNVDITDALHPGDNLIAVRVDNTEQPNSRWYSGCGIYRDVRLHRVDPVHIPLWGLHFRQLSAGPDPRYSLETTIANTTDTSQPYTLTITPIDPDGRQLEPIVITGTVGARDTIAAIAEGTIADVRLWDIDSPERYRFNASLASADRQLDSYETPAGFKTTSFHPSRGFSLNGRRMKLNGVCLHHDAGCLGAAAPRRAVERQLQIMKEMGVNAIRCSHNPPSRVLLELCDSMGLMVMDETFDMWRLKKTAHDYARYFDRWHVTDMTDQIKRDRNHPSIIMWSIGNEVLEQGHKASADTLTAAQANFILNFPVDDDVATDTALTNLNAAVARHLADLTRRLDPDRPVTAGCNHPNKSNNLFRPGTLDIIGFNYHDSQFADVPVNFPGRPFVVTESVSSLMTRGYYRGPVDSLMVWPSRWDLPFYDESLACSSYGNCRVPWGSTDEETMRNVMENDFIMGQFVWTGFDYIGEPTPYPWPARSSYFGIVDLAGFPKDIYYFYKAMWRPDEPTLHLLPHWNHAHGDTVEVMAYYNQATDVDLYLNGRHVGTSAMTPERMHARWRVAWEPGTLLAVSRLGDIEIARDSVVTAGAPAAIVLEADRPVLNAMPGDLCYVTARIVDDAGVECPTACNTLSFDIAGAGTIAGTDNGSPIDLTPFKSPARDAFNGRALLVVAPAGNAGTIDITATAPGLAPGRLTVTAR